MEVLPMEREQKSEVGKKDRKNPGNCTVFVVVAYLSHDPFGGLYEIQIKQDGKVVDGGVTDIHKYPPLSPRCKPFEINPLDQSQCYLECAWCHESSELLMFPVTGTGHYMPVVAPENTCGFVFDIKNNFCTPFEPPPPVTKPAGAVICAYGKLYFLAHPLCYPHISDLSFRRCDLKYRTWETLASYPYSASHAVLEITGYAVCYGCILISLCDRLTKNCHYKVFHIGQNKWCRVKDYPEYPFEGRAVVVGDTIYAPPIYRHGIMAFSLSKRSNSVGDLIYCLGTPSLLWGLFPAIPPIPLKGIRSQFLVHLGSYLFCRIDTGFNYEYNGYQNLRITTFKVEGQRIETIDSSFRAVNICDVSKFTIKFCFTPNLKDFEPPEEESSLACGSNTEEDEETSQDEDFAAVPVDEMFTVFYE